MEKQKENKTALKKNNSYCRSGKIDFLVGFFAGTSFMSIVIMIMLATIIGFCMTSLSKDSLRNVDYKNNNNVVEKTESDNIDVKPSAVDNLKNEAKKLNLNTNKFNDCIDRGKYAEKITKQIKEGQSIGVKGTPATFINGYFVSGAHDISLFKEIIDAILAGEKVESIEAYKSIFPDKKIPAPVKIDTSRDYILGTKAKIMLVEYSDFECPYSKKHSLTVEKISKEYKGKIGIVYRHFPLPFHANAQKMAEAAECAGEQGKFWEMHDKIFAK